MRLLEIRRLSKYYAETDTLANDGVSLSLDAGELRAVVGENGAGKSTLARIIAGLAAPDSGEILVRGSRLRSRNVREAEAAGIGFVPQHSLLASSLTVAENLALGREPKKLGFFFDRDRAFVDAAFIIERYGFRMDPSALVESLSPAERRRAEIARALARGGEILVLDEPTSIMSESESEELFALLSRLAAGGKAILFITHRLAEVRSFASTITVLREGRVVADMAAAGADEAALAAMMARSSFVRAGTGADARAQSAARESADDRSEGGSPVFEMRGVILARGAKPIDVAVGRGEILGVAALPGNGLESLEDCASGMREPIKGGVFLKGRSLASLPRGRTRARELAYVPSDREGRGLCLLSSSRDNALVLRREEFGFLDWIAGRKRDAMAREDAARTGLDLAPRARASTLSGGNRQRLVLAREIGRPRSAALLAEPFQGLDLAAQAEAAQLIRKMAREGSAVLALSSSLDELFPIADRIAILYRNELVHVSSNRGPSSFAEMLSLMTGFGRKAFA